MGVNDGRNRLHCFPLRKQLIRVLEYPVIPHRYNTLKIKEVSSVRPFGRSNTTKSMLSRLKQAFP